ncbi:MAG: hypothetical protein N3G22_03340 [Candidatus Micrarchaeota archaeon]|nr:hypothetical protein [Candidatus Micrarchaeota archaeon]
MEYSGLLEQFVLSTSNFMRNIIDGFFALAIFLAIIWVGFYVATWIGDLARKFLRGIKLEKFLEEHGIHDSFVGFSFSSILVVVLKVYIVLAFLGIAAEVVRLPFLVSLALQASAYFPMLIQGLAILLAALVAGDYITDKIKESRKIPFANTLAILIEVFIAYNALVIAMPLLLPAADPSLLIYSFLIVLGAFGLALGLGGAIAIGLGLKDVVSEVAKKNKDKFSRLM